jgi:hypothetical protein
MNLNQFAIWGLIKAELSKETLKSISLSDGGYDSDEHYEALLSIFEKSETPITLRWEPKEVLALVGWRESVGRSDKELWEILFCNFIILVSSIEENSNDREEGRSEKAIIALDCSVKLGRKALESFYEFVKQINERISLSLVEEDLLYLYLAEYICAKLTDQDISVVKAIGKRLIEAEKQVAEIFECNIEYHKDIFKYTFFDQRAKLWENYYSHYCGEHETYRTKELGRLFSAPSH